MLTNDLMAGGERYQRFQRAAHRDRHAILHIALDRFMQVWDDYANSGRIKVATDVFPQEPVPSDDPLRKQLLGENLLLSAHRTGGMAEALHQIGRMTVADAELILCPAPAFAQAAAADSYLVMAGDGPQRNEVQAEVAKLGIGDRTEIEFFVGPHTINGKGTYAFLRKHLNWNPAR